MAVRIHEISKKLGLENREILAKARALGIAAARVPSSFLDSNTAKYLEEELLKVHPELARTLLPPAATQGAPEMPLWRRSMLLRRPLSPPAATQGAATPTKNNVNEPLWRQRLRPVAKPLAEKAEPDLAPDDLARWRASRGRATGPVASTTKKSPAAVEPCPKSSSAHPNESSLERAFRAKLQGDVLIIDSNIWMKPECEPIFEVLLRLKMSCVIIGDQFDEITNKKDRTKFGTPENDRARLAIDRVERLQEADLCEIPDLAFAPNKSALADPGILKFAAGEAGQKRFITFVTDDKELRVRGKAILKKKAPNLHRVLKGLDLLADAEEIVKRWKSP